MSQAVDDHARAKGRSNGVAVLHPELINERLDMSRLSDRYGERFTRDVRPFVSAAKVPVHWSHPVNLETGGEFSFKVLLDGVRFRKVFKIVDIGPKVNGRVSVENNTSEDAWVMGTRLQTDGEKGILEGVIPMKGAATETV